MENTHKQGFFIYQKRHTQKRQAKQTENTHWQTFFFWFIYHLNFWEIQDSARQPPSRKFNFRVSRNLTNTCNWTAIFLFLVWEKRRSGAPKLPAWSKTRTHKPLLSFFDLSTTWIFRNFDILLTSPPSRKLNFQVSRNLNKLITNTSNLGEMLFFCFWFEKKREGKRRSCQPKATRTHTHTQTNLPNKVNEGEKQIWGRRPNLNHYAAQ